MGERNFNLQQLIVLLAVVALVAGIVFHIIYLVKDRDVETAKDEWLKNNALMFFGMAIALATAGVLWGKHKVRLAASLEM